MALPKEPIIKRFFSNKIESTRDDWFSYLISIARIFYSFDGAEYNREALLKQFSNISGRSADAERDESNFRDEFGAYGTYLGLYHLEEINGKWTIIVSEAAKQFLCTESPNAAAFCRCQMALFQYPNGAGAVLTSSGSVNVQANCLAPTAREIAHGIRINPFRLLCRLFVGLIELEKQPISKVSVSYSTLFCLMNDNRINTTYNPTLESLLSAYHEYADPNASVSMNMEGLNKFKRNFHIFEKTGLFVRDSRFGFLVSPINYNAAFECIKTISEMEQYCDAFDDIYNNFDEVSLKKIIAGSSWGRYYDASNLPKDTLLSLGVELDEAPIKSRAFQNIAAPQSNEGDDGNNGLCFATNILLYGVPGCGKSHTIKTEFCDDDSHMERVVFHPDYTYSDFIGQILPEVDNGHIKYRFKAGPFTRILKMAFDTPSEYFYLVVEEINRGNASAIFGDVFQLMDRDESGWSEYGVSNESIAAYVHGDKSKKIKIPGNLFVLATMNTSDQNVFTLDTAFKRRWSSRMIDNNIDACKLANQQICDSGVTWGVFAKSINQKIIEFGENNLSNEDNRLGAYFVREADLKDASLFAEKILMYLWNDAFKFDHEKIFRPDYRTLDELIHAFTKIGFDVFSDEIVFEKQENGQERQATTETPTADKYLEKKNPELVAIYQTLFSAVKEKIPNAYDSSVGSLQYASWRASDIKKASFADVSIKKDGISLQCEQPTSEELRSIGEPIAIDNHHNHYFKINFDAEKMDLIVEAIVDSYNQLKVQQG